MNPTPTKGIVLVTNVTMGTANFGPTYVTAANASGVRGTANMGPVRTI